MATHVCPWWFTPSFDNPLRRLFHDPQAILVPFVREGMRVADLGCGMGYFTVPLAELVGPGGHVQAVDLQPRQLAQVERRARRRGVRGTIELVLAEPTDLKLTPPLDFVLAFWMVHEVPDAEALFRQIAAALAPGGRVLVAEPRVHVRARELETTLALARRAGLEPAAGPRIAVSRTALLTRAA